MTPHGTSGETQEPLAVAARSRMDLRIFDVELADGRRLLVPLDWFPRLRDATAEQVANFRLIGGGALIHWPDLDEDLSVAGLLRRHVADDGFWHDPVPPESGGT